MWSQHPEQIFQLACRQIKEMAFYFYLSVSEDEIELIGPWGVGILGSSASVTAVSHSWEGGSLGESLFPGKIRFLGSAVDGFKFRSS